ncbi:molybdopterin-dependent oxidoreductase [Halalkalirubrum salinum]|uniref:molybdopterin-dependent oxidoreductase n=1 Tax=Halalkalirubrum salinum TaxID=2563889 RepID=UPI0010FBA32A|nr:molybdopterin-dependent oxidoreductase [Halalkalirubrum salinum]
MLGLDRLRAAVAAIEPPPRLVDWSLFLALCVEVVTGLVSFTIGTPDGWPIFWIHRIVGLTIVALVAFKLARVRYRLTDSRHWQPSTLLSVLTAIAAIGALATGIVWVFGADVRLSHWTLLSVHVGFGLALFALLLPHMWTRFRPPRRVDLADRRAVLQYAGLLIGGAIVYRGQEAVNAVAETTGSKRRFTGSYPRTGEGNGSFPVTSWVADDPEPIDTDEWTLSIDGLVGEPIAIGYDELTGERERQTEQRALLDCTSGWYTEQSWRGRRVGELIDAAGGSTTNGKWVRFVSVTGYRWSLPIDEARETLIATHVGGDRLNHGHGAPARLVAPGRRGFQWVKWVTRIEVRERNDPAQWIVTLISGFE